MPKFGAGAALLAAAALGGAASVPATAQSLAVPAAAVADGPARPAVFGTVPVAIRAQPTSARWARVMNASLDQPALARLTRGAGGMSPQAQAAYVQAAVNRAVRTSSHTTNCADDGYWAAAGETLTRGVGDCIDIAIAKMEALRRLGFQAQDLYLATGYAGAGGREAAALLVRTGDGFWLLTERGDQPIPAGAGATTAFKPMVTYGVGRTWVHGRRVHAPAPAVTLASRGGAGIAAR